ELFELVATAQLALAHIGAAAEGAPAPIQDCDFGFRIEIEAAERIRQLSHNLVADRIEFVRPVEGDCRDAVGAGIVDEVLFVRIHRSLPRSARSRAACEGRRAAVNAAPPEASRLRRSFLRRQMTWNTYSKMMIGIGIPRSHRRTPRIFRSVGCCGSVAVNAHRKD